jgi:FMN phosphatase YigB (HAD superfamily)
VTNGNADIDRIGIGHYFDASAAAHEVGFGKPDPRIFEHACSRVGVQASRVLHVGDDLELDILGARGAGMHAAWLRRPDLLHQARHRPQTEGVAPLAALAPVFSDLRAIEQALDRA